ncbi:DNA-binding protein [Otariodibacter oris]|uniref:Nlp family transcriptional regulator n=1 Tax=Otariodibacter oris TaxID=1032623 RepID=A0A420XIU3_9PAST|nr:DNA-binding protein [Otariodibacter oris]QGM80695.1 DNA-binding protein [Otariodibacter oris]RKR77143.1 hypothetical protein DES31_0467 [Otariodibacter oris]
MDQKEIYQALKDKGLNAVILAKALDVSVQAISSTIKKGKGSLRIANAISIAIDKPIEKTFPYYEEKQLQQQARKQQIEQLKTKLSQEN